MTAVEWYAEEFAEHLEETYGVKITSLSLLKKAKEMEVEQRQSEYTRGFDDGCQRKQQELDHLRGKNHSCKDNFKNPFKNEPKEQ